MTGCTGCACSADAVKREASRAGVKTYGCVSGVCAGFRDFILRGNVVDLAVAIVVGTSFTALVNAIVADWLTPFIAVIFKPDQLFADLSFWINGSQFRYGHFLNVLLTFVLVCTVCYFLVIWPINSLIKAVYPVKKTRPCPECCSDIPVTAKRCKFCCVPVEPLPTQSSKPKLLDDDEVITRAKTAPASLATSETKEARVEVDATGAGGSPKAPAAPLPAAAAGAEEGKAAPPVCNKV